MFTKQNNLTIALSVGLAIAVSFIMGGAQPENLGKPKPKEPTIEIVEIENRIGDETAVAILKDDIVVNIVAVPPGWPNVENAWQTQEEFLISGNAHIGDEWDGEFLIREIKTFND